MDMRTMHKGHNTVTILAKNQNMLSDPRLPELQGEWSTSSEMAQPVVVVWIPRIQLPTGWHNAPLKSALHGQQPEGSIETGIVLLGWR